ncbi:MAG: DUF4198 domain-containing protein, partial [Mailhella sp.]|nr:DUF4198 domain-containing protein [Mailhella sp.]
MNVPLLRAALCAVMLAAPCAAQAHFGMVVPSDNVVEDQAGAAISIEFSFSHPMEMQGMELAMPRAVTVTSGGKTADLKGALRPAKVMGH